MSIFITNMKSLHRNIIFSLFFCFSFNIFAEEYNLKVLGENTTRELSIEMEKLVLAETEFKWTDSDANFG